MFSMFVASPSSGIPVNTVYREKQAFGPFGKFAGDIATDEDSGFSEALWLEVAQSAPEEFRTLHVFCAGTIQVIGVQEGFPSDASDSPRVIELTPSQRAITELGLLFPPAGIETPKRFIYHGLAPNSLREHMQIYLNTLSEIHGPIRLRTAEGKVVSIEEVGIKTFLDGFLNGNNQIYLVEDLAMGWPLGDISDKNLDAGHFSFGIEVRTGPPLVSSSPLTPTLTKNYLDPVVVYHELIGSNLSDGTPAILMAETSNSWLEVVTKDRVLFTFRDEWNASLTSGELAVVEGTGAGQVVVMSLTDKQHGTLVARDGGSPYTCQISTPPSRKLTPIPSDQGASDTLSIHAAAPAHRVVDSVRPKDWFHPTDPPHAPEFPGLELSLFTEGNIVTDLIDGFESFARLVKDLKELDDPSPPSGPPTAGGMLLPDNFVLLAGWWMDIDFLLVPSDQSSSVGFLLQRAAKSQHHLIVRGMVWGPNDEKLGNPALGLSIIDTQRPGFTEAHATILEPVIAAFHWKLSVVRNRHGTYAQLGGIDINPNRLDGPEHKRAGNEYHDVHCRIQGPAVQDIVKAFRLRYQAETAGSVVTDSITPTTTTPAGSPATQMVQIARTSLKDLYPESPDGDRTIWATFRRAIRRARKYIYLEEQYLVYGELRDELLTVLPNIDHLIIVVDGKTDDLSIAPILEATIPGYSAEKAKSRAKEDTLRARYLFLNPLVQSAEGSKVRVFELRTSHGPYYCHSKVAIIDDIFVKIGSANMNRRGMTHDSELDAFILDGRVEEGARKFARDLRINLWGEHLGWHLDPATARARLADVDRAVEWLTARRPNSARLSPYNFSKGAGASYPTGWDSIIDPDGSTP